MALVDNIKVMGSPLNDEVRRAITACTIDGDYQSVMQLSITISDPRWALLSQGVFKLNMRVEIDDLIFDISNITTGDSSEVETVEVKCRPQIVRKLKARRGAKVMKNASPSEFVISECKAVGAKYVVQSSASRSQVARDVPKQGEKPEVQSPPSSYTTFQRFANELGYYFFEVAGTVYFGKPSWLMTHVSTKSVSANYITNGDKGIPMVTTPRASRSLDDPATTVDLGLIVTDLLTARPGRRLELSGVPTFNGSYLISRFSADLLDDTCICDVTGTTPLNPEPQPPTTGKTAASTRLGTLLSTDLVYWLQKQIGDKWVEGTQVSLSSNDPNQFDGSELLQWGAAQVGAFMPDKPNDQIAWAANNGCEVSVASALKTRGAFLWSNNRIAICIGSGRTLENVNGRVGIVRSGQASRYSRGGRIPGVLY